MKKAISLLYLVTLTIGLLGSCSKINDRLDNLEKRVDDIENKSIATIQQQMDEINVSIIKLTATDATINGQISELNATARSHQVLIDALKAADQSLGQKDEKLEALIADLEDQVAIIDSQIKTLEDADKAINIRIDSLRSYVDTELDKVGDWATETFATLDQYQQTADDLAILSVTVAGIDTTLTDVMASIADLDTKIDGLDAALQEKITSAKAELEGKIKSLKTELEGKIASAISASETSIKAWINELLEGYYTAAQVDAKVTELNTSISNIKDADKARIDSLATELTTLKTAVDTAKAAIRTEYRNAIDVAINRLDGEIRGAIKESIAAVNGIVETLNTKVTALESRIRTIESKVRNLEAMIQSVSITPAYSDGSVEAVGGILAIKFIVRPAEALSGITSLKDSLLLYADFVKVRTRAEASAYMEIPVTAATVLDDAQGAITLRANIANYLPTETDKSLVVALNVKNGISDYTTEFYPVTLSPNVTVKDETDTTKVTIKADADFPEFTMGTITVASGFTDSKPTTITVEGIGNITFDKEATAKIKSNAQSEGATNVFFKVEDVTTTKPVPNADVVLEVTMKTVDENGIEVFSKGKEAGEVTIEIPMDENVAYVNSVTLVNDAGEPIPGGVVPGSKVFDKENGILTFKVNHFSKYAIDYVTKTDFVKVTGVSLNKDTLNLEVGDTLKLVATITPEDATNKNVTWSSSNESVATVDNDGKVTAVAAGTATITVTTEDGGKTATCAVTVNNPVVNVTGVTLNKNTTTLIVGGTETLIATIAPADATNKNVTWSSSNESVATVDNDGKVTAVAAGTATITATTVDGNKTATCAVKVSETKTMDDILKTTTGIPESVNLTPPANAWVNSTNTGCKAFVGKDGEAKLFVILKEGQPSASLKLRMDDAFAKIDDNTYQRIESSMGTITIKMAEGKFSSLEFQAESGSAYEQFNGTYSAPAAPTEYTVTFDLNGISGTAPEAQKIEENSKVTKPADPTYANHTFAGWYKTKDATTGALSDPWDFGNDIVTADMTLYAKWTRTLGSIYGTNENVPKSDNNSAPDNAWENGEGGKAFIAFSGKNSEGLYLYKKLETSGANQLICKKTENFTKIGDDYVLFYELQSRQLGVYTLHMTDGKFTSVTYNGAGTDYSELSGTYKAPTLSGVTLDKTELSLMVGDSETLKATVQPADATNKNVIWSSDNTSVATVDNDGKVTAVAAGTATITVTTVDGAKTATCEVTVIAPNSLEKYNTEEW